MQLSNLPARIAAIFAASAAPTSKNTIPLTQAGITQPGQASFDVGFPAITMQPAASGGINPYGQDFNGMFFDVTGVEQWLCAGGSFTYDATFSTTVGGYPLGAMILRADGTGFWFNQVDANTTNPDTGGAGWVPSENYGITAVTGLTNANVTLTALQYSRKVITLAGTLTGNVNIVLPTTLQQWLLVNNTSGAFTVTAKTSAGTGIAIPQGQQAQVWGDGTNINASSLPYAGPRLSIVTATGNFTVPAGVYALDVEIWGGGGAGGGNGSTGAGSSSGGGSGAYARGIFAVTPGQVIACTVGAGGPGSTASNGGSSSFGTLLTVGGGTAGPGNGVGNVGTGGAAGTGGSINTTGGSGAAGLTTGNGPGGVGGAAPYGGPGGASAAGIPAAGGIPGGGGGGRGSTTAGVGADGGRGQINIHY